MTEWTNLLYYGDNLDILRRYIKDESVDLVYLDPPFKSDQNYNILFEEKNGSQAASQIKAFDDTWSWTEESQAVYEELVTKGGPLADVMRAFHTFLGPCDMLAYLVMMAPRLHELHRVMKPTGSIYLHCDPTASHYLKMLLDAVFKPQGFRNEIIWCYKRWPAKQKNFQKMHDVVLRYSKSADVIWNQLYDDFTAQTKKRIKGGKKIEHYVGESGKILIRPTAEQSPGVAMCDYWNIPMIAGQGKERLGYPTQKPEALLERIVRASSNEGDIVLDPFCGCGTAVAVAQRLKRHWIGIDITPLAINLIKTRLNDAFGNEVKYRVIGEPVSVPDAEALARADPYQFQIWALGLVNARPVELKKGADKGIDGKIVFVGDKKGSFETIILSVKAGHLTANQVRDLRGVVEREKAAIGVLISMETPTKPMKKEAITAGFFTSKSWHDKYPKIQLLTIADLLAGKQIQMPPIRQVGATFKKAPKAKGKRAGILKLPLPGDGA